MCRVLRTLSRGGCNSPPICIRNISNEVFLSLKFHFKKNIPKKGYFCSIQINYPKTWTIIIRIVKPDQGKNIPLFIKNGDCV